MSQTITKKLKQFCALAFCLGALWNNTVLAQSGVTEAAAESQLLQIMLPADAQRVSPQSVPAEITQTLAKVIDAGEGKFRRGDSEVLAWGGAGYQKASAPKIVSRLTGSLKTAGWQYAVQGEEAGMTVFTALKESPRRAVVGLYGATDDALIFAAMEILPNGGAASAASKQVESDNSIEQAQKSGAGQNSQGAGIVGTWTNGTVGMMGEKYQDGTVAARRGTTFKYVFHPDGSFEFVGYAESTMYGCMTSLFQDKRGRYTINGSQITLALSKNFWRNQYSCSPASNKERDYTLGTETYELRTKTDEYGKSLICLANDKGESCYRREN